MTTSTIEDYTRTSQDRTLEALRQSQAVMVEAVGTWAKSVQGTVPQAPPVPFAQELPTPEEIVATNFDFAARLLAAQREFIESLVSAAAPAWKPAEPREKKGAGA